MTAELSDPTALAAADATAAIAAAGPTAAMAAIAAPARRRSRGGS